MDYQTLKTEISLPAYSGMTDQEIADSLNAATISTFKKVEYSDVASYLRVVGKWLAIHESALESARSFKLDMQTFNSFDLSKPRILTFPTVQETVNTALDALITDSLIDATDKAVILSMADDTISRARELGLPVIKTGHIETARVL